MAVGPQSQIFHQGTCELNNEHERNYLTLPIDRQGHFFVRCAQKERSNFLRFDSVQNLPEW
jgi:Ulp1 family protease